ARADPPAAKPAMVLQIGPGHGIDALAYSPDGKSLSTAESYPDDIVRVWDLASKHLKAVLHADDSIERLTFSPDGRTLAAWDPGFGASPAGGGLILPIHLWDVESSRPKVDLEGAYGPVAFSPNGKTLAAQGLDANGDCTAQLWDVASGLLQ